MAGVRAPRAYRGVNSVVEGLGSGGTCANRPYADVGVGGGEATTDTNGRRAGIGGADCYGGIWDRLASLVERNWGS